MRKPLARFSLVKCLKDIKRWHCCLDCLVTNQPNQKHITSDIVSLNSAWCCETCHVKHFRHFWGLPAVEGEVTRVMVGHQPVMTNNKQELNTRSLYGLWWSYWLKCLCWSVYCLWWSLYGLMFMMLIQDFSFHMVHGCTRVLHVWIDKWLTPHHVKMQTSDWLLRKWFWNLVYWTCLFLPTSLRCLLSNKQTGLDRGTNIGIMIVYWYLPSSIPA